MSALLIEAFVCTACDGTGEQFDLGPTCRVCDGNGTIPVDAVPTEHHREFSETTWIPAPQLRAFTPTRGGNDEPLPF